MDRIISYLTDSNYVGYFSEWLTVWLIGRLNATVALMFWPTRWQIAGQRENGESKSRITLNQRSTFDNDASPPLPARPPNTCIQTDTDTESDGQDYSMSWNPWGLYIVK